MNRIGQAFLWVGGFALAALMGYTVYYGAGTNGPRSAAAPGGDADVVAVVYPDRTLWREFREGVLTCVRKKLAVLVAESDGSIVVRTARHKRPIRFELHDVRGLRETRKEVQDLLDGSPPPVAFVGSSNTVLTAAIAEALAAGAARGGVPGPLLLVPWASSVLAERPEPGEGPVTLLDICPGRTFRFCPNNQFQADMLVDCLLAREAGRAPERAVLVVDRHDPFSVDLAAAIHRAVERVAPEADIVERADSLGLPVAQDETNLPGPAEESLADSIWREAERLPAGHTTWVFLPLQQVPTLRFLTALRRHARRVPGPGLGPLRVVCGDGIGFPELAQLAGRCPFPVWCSSSATVPAAAQALGKGVSPDTQVPAEIVAAVVLGLDAQPGRRPASETLRDALGALRLGPDDPAAMGRSLAFRRSGERAGDDLGHVLMIRPDRPGVFALARGPSGRWGEPEPLRSASLAVRP